MSLIKDFFNKIRHSYYGIGKVMAFLVAIALVWWQMPRTGKFKYEYQLSKPWQHETLYAPFDFPIYKDFETLNAETEAATAHVKPIFVFNDNEMAASRNQLFAGFEAQWDAASHFDRDLNLDCLYNVFDSIEGRGIVAYDNATANLKPESEVSIVRNKVMRSTRYGDFYSMNGAADAVRVCWTTREANTTKSCFRSYSMVRCARMCFTMPTLPKRSLTRWFRPSR